MLRGQETDPGLISYADSLNMLTYKVLRGKTENKDEMLFAVSDGQWKYIHHKIRQHESELYNLFDDPGETTNLFSAEPAVVRRLRKNLEDRKAFPGKAPDLSGMSESDVERLRSLGYIQ